jgi:hypothetical protein
LMKSGINMVVGMAQLVRCEVAVKRARKLKTNAIIFRAHLLPL